MNPKKRSITSWVVVAMVALFAAGVALFIDRQDPSSDESGHAVSLFFPLWGSLFFGIMGLIMLPVAFARLFREIRRSIRDFSWVNRRIPAGDGAVRTSRWSRLQMPETPSSPPESVNRVKWMPAITLACAGLFCVGAAAVQWLGGNRLFAVLLGALAIAPLLSTSGWRSEGAFSGSATVGPSGVVLRTSRRMDLVGFVVLLDLTVVLLAWGVLGELGIVTSPAVLTEIRGNFLIMFGSVGLLTGFFLVGLIKRGGVGYLRLSVDGFEFGDGIFTTRGTWSEVAAISNVNPQRGAQPVRAVTLVNAEGCTATVQRPDYYVAHADALLDWIGFYWQHPERRQELTDDRALARLRTAEAVADA